MLDPLDARFVPLAVVILDRWQFFRSLKGATGVDALTASPGHQG